MASWLEPAGAAVRGGPLADGETDREVDDALRRDLIGERVPAAGRHEEREERENLWKSGHRERET